MLHMTCDMCVVTCDLWQVNGDTGQATCDMCDVTCDTWQVIGDTWHVTCCGGGEISRKRMTESMNQWVGDKGVCRTATATPGLLDIIILDLLEI